MKHIRRLLMLVLLSLVVVGCATTKGTVSGGKYQSPLNNFSITLPNWVGLKIQDQNDNEGGRVSFLDDFGNLWAVTYLRVPTDSSSVFGDPDRRDRAYRGFVSDYAMPVLFRKSVPDSSVVKDEFIDARGIRVYFVVVNIPGASNILDPKKNQRLDSIRGLMVFDKNGFIYMLETEMNSVFSPTYASSLTAKQVERTQATLVRIKESMTFK